MFVCSLCYTITFLYLLFRADTKDDLILTETCKLHSAPTDTYMTPSCVLCCFEYV